MYRRIYTSKDICRFSIYLLLHDSIWHVLFLQTRPMTSPILSSSLTHPRNLFSFWLFQSSPSQILRVLDLGFINFSPERPGRYSHHGPSYNLYILSLGDLVLPVKCHRGTLSIREISTLRGQNTRRKRFPDKFVLFQETREFQWLSTSPTGELVRLSTGFTF